MQYEPRVIAGRLREFHPDLIKATAPKEFVKAVAEADKRHVEFLTAFSEADEARTQQPIAEAQYKFDVEQAVVNDEPTPLPLGPERAQARVRVAEREARRTEDALYSADATAGNFMRDPANRAAWAKTLTQTAANMLAEYEATIDRVETLARTYQNLIGMTYSLGEFGNHVAIPVRSADPVGELRRIAAWQPWQPGLNITAANAFTV